MKYEDVREFIRASLEYEMAGMARRQSLVGPSEVAKLGAIAFPAGAEKYRRAVDVVVREAASTACGVKFSSDPAGALDVDRAFPTNAQLMRAFASKAARDILGHESNAAARRASGLHRVEMPADFHPAFDCGVWDRSATYSRGAMTTDHGTLWSCQVDGTSDRPGTSGAWRLMVKSQQKTGTR